MAKSGRRSPPYQSFVSGKSRAFAAAAALALTGYLAATLVTGAGHAAGPVLDASVGPGFTISLTQGGTPVTSLAPGSYTIDVSDMGSIHDFHLQGPGVDQKTGISFTGTATWDVTFSGGAYSFFCDAHQASMNGAFTVAAPATSSTTSSTSSTTSTAPPPVTSTATASTTTATTSTPTTTAPPPSTTTTAPVTTTPTSTDTTTSPPPSVTAQVVQSLRVQAQGRRARRVILVRVDLAKAGAVRVRLLRRGRRVASMSKQVGAKPATLTLHVPAAAAPGRYSVEVVAAGKRIVRTVSLPR
jgi:hypothetical protein